MTELSKIEWQDAIERAVALSAPDNHGPGFARFVVQERVDNGDYERYLNGDYGQNLWEPEA